MNYEDKYKLSRDESIFLSKRKWDENVYCGMKMENRAVTFPQTKTILQGINVPGVQIDDIQAILNMRDAWKFIFETFDQPLTLDYICKLNEYVARNEALTWGKLRNGQVGISGTEYLPPIPDEDVAREELNKILVSGNSVTSKALDIFLWGTRSQLFWDGNKRTSILAANKLLISNGAGMLTICDKNMERFNELLLNYYDTGIGSDLKKFLYENNICGILSPCIRSKHSL